MYRFLKRCFDLAFAAMALLFLSPLFVVVMILLRFTGEGEMLYVQQRIGRGGREFGLFKFVTMRKDSPKYGAVTIEDDPRVLPVGRYLRISKINELPQLLNVLLGHMSVVGPRPLVDETFSCYLPEVQETIVQMKPGLTGVGSLIFRNEERILAQSEKPRLECYREDIASLKGALEQWYFAHRSFALDLKIVLATGISVALPAARFPLRWLEIQHLLERSSLRHHFVG